MHRRSYQLWSPPRNTKQRSRSALLKQEHHERERKKRKKIQKKVKMSFSRYSCACGMFDLLFSKNKNKNAKEFDTGRGRPENKHGFEVWARSNAVRSECVAAALKVFGPAGVDNVVYSRPSQIECIEPSLGTRARRTVVIVLNLRGFWSVDRFNHLQKAPYGLFIFRMQTRHSPLLDI